jgi:hypothetical protein
MESPLATESVPSLLASMRAWPTAKFEDKPFTVNPESAWMLKYAEQEIKWLIASELPQC